MTFIITMIALMMERFFHWHHLRHWRWFLRYEAWLSRYIGQLPANLRLIINIFLPMLVVGLLTYLLKGWLYGILQLIFEVIVLLYCLGPENLWVQVYKIISDMKKDDPKLAVNSAKSAFQIATPNSSSEFHSELVRASFIAAHERIFSVIFWFVILGPLGAVLYRLIELFSVQTELGLTKTAEQWKSALDWIPVRLFTFLFALGGHFTEVMAVWKKEVWKGFNANDSLLSNCGVAALDVMEEGQVPETGEAEQAALDLLDRVFVIGLVILAIIVILI